MSEREHTVKELDSKFFLSEPTVRRDILVLEKKDIVVRKSGKVNLKINAADKRIPLFIRNMEQQQEKREIALKAVSHIKDGDVIMLDASTTVYCMLPYLANFKEILVVTNGAKTAIELAVIGIKRYIQVVSWCRNRDGSFYGNDFKYPVNNNNSIDVFGIYCPDVTIDKKQKM